VILLLGFSHRAHSFPQGIPAVQLHVYRALLPVVCSNLLLLLFAYGCGQKSLYKLMVSLVTSQQLMLIVLGVLSLLVVGTELLYSVRFFVPFFSQ
jgi:hypothetical protein